MIDTGLKNKIVLKTGVNNPHGIGAATAKAFATEGAAIFATYLRLPAKESTTNVPGEAFYRTQNAKAADEVVAALRERGGKIEAWEADLVDPAVIPQMFDRAERAFGLWIYSSTMRRTATRTPSFRLRRVGQPEDVADVIVFFASEQARWVTGQLLYVGGGHVMPLRLRQRAQASKRLGRSTSHIGQPHFISQEV